MKHEWTDDELIEHWTLLPNEMEWLANKTGATRLGFAALLKYWVSSNKRTKSLTGF